MDECFNLKVILFFVDESPVMPDLIHIRVRHIPSLTNREVFSVESPFARRGYVHRSY